MRQKEEMIEKLFELEIRFEEISATIKERIWTGIQIAAEQDEFLANCLREREDLEFQAYVCGRDVQEDPDYREINNRMSVAVNQFGAGAALQELLEMRTNTRKEIRLLQKSLKIEKK
jgi:hypothetical protein